ncbi:DMT family transporter [Sulfobacillus harzensis]|uniref:EamA family transporter n=1 Tax=Sulfobacillus harzensis TaxID=2729629 RepID=A0A7Y0Q4Y6_9FIRM|nr:DMT family transporter [Sulfobacillus harzensis]NMP25112.1 EamA family transporter [Sulfobacillus harzensis]
MNDHVPVPSPKVSPSRRLGIAMVLFSASSWGLSGTASQVLFQHQHLTAAWLVSVRMLFSGMVLVGWGMLRRNPASRALAANWRRWPQLLIFAAFGLFGVQYSYFKAIAEGNAATGTLLQYLGPPMMVAYLAVKNRQAPDTRERWAIVFAILGTLLLVSGGHFGRLEVPLDAVVWGLLSALCLAFYTLYPGSLLQTFDAVSVVGWGMLLGGLVSLSTGGLFQVHKVAWSFSTVALVAFVVLLGTLAAFLLYLASLRVLSPSEAGLLATAEPVAAVTASLLFLHVHLDLIAILGGLAIIVAVIQLSRKKAQEAPITGLPYPPDTL